MTKPSDDNIRAQRVNSAGGFFTACNCMLDQIRSALNVKVAASTRTSATRRGVRQTAHHGTRRASRLRAATGSVDSTTTCPAPG